MCNFVSLIQLMFSLKKSYINTLTNYFFFISLLSYIMMYVVVDFIVIGVCKENTS